MESSIRKYTAVAPVNIAVIKYWGKRDEELILPINDSISVTLSTDEMCATTTVASSSNFEQDSMWLNKKKEDIKTNKRLLNLIKRLKLQTPLSGQYPVHICSENNFPTAAGLASSAAGYACLVYSLGLLYGVDGDLSILARQGSGSACRSVYGGFVHWIKGHKDDGSDSMATQIASKNHWPELRIIILVVNAEKKQTGSTDGMRRSYETSELIQHRASTVVPQRIEDMTRAIQSKDFHTFAEITMRDSNQFHAICLDTYPPIRYMNNTSFAIVDLVHKYNSFYGTNKVAYTFDAGPNACLFVLEQDLPEVMEVILKAFPSNNSEQYVRGIEIPTKNFLKQELAQFLQIQPIANALQFIISTKVGDGPKKVDHHLLNDDGLPK